MSRAEQVPPVVVVTGAARGIGAAVARRLARDGHGVCALDLGFEVDELGDAAVERVVADVTDAEAVGAAVDRAAALGPLAGLVNNAGVNAHFDPVELTEAEWDRFMAVDLKSAWLCTRAVVPHLRARGGGAIVNVASIHARLTKAGMFPYAAAKAGLVGLTRSLALELGPEGVRVNAVAPGFTATRLVLDDLARQEDPEAAVRELDALHPLGRICAPDEIAAAVAFLLGEDASAITGAELAVDAGLSARMAA
jgi:NAD(P)-dependent dehydrogenase (short-subunit alcohol dehydrogenase family)